LTRARELDFKQKEEGVEVGDHIGVERIMTGERKPKRRYLEEK